MTPLTGMSASQAAEELRRYADLFYDIPLTRPQALHLASLLEQEARDTERLRKAVEDAPHGSFCATHPDYNPATGKVQGRPCDCWKSRLQEANP